MDLDLICFVSVQSIEWQCLLVLVHSVHCKRDLHVRDWDIWLYIRDETSLQNLRDETWPRHFKNRSRDRLETETSRPRLHPCYIAWVGALQSKTPSRLWIEKSNTVYLASSLLYNNDHWLMRPTNAWVPMELKQFMFLKQIGKSPKNKQLLFTVLLVLRVAGYDFYKTGKTKGIALSLDPHRLDKTYQNICWRLTSHQNNTCITTSKLSYVIVIFVYLVFSSCSL